MDNTMIRTQSSLSILDDNIQNLRQQCIDAGNAWYDHEKQWKIYLSLGPNFRSKAELFRQCTIEGMRTHHTLLNELDRIRALWEKCRQDAHKGQQGDWRE